MGKKLVFWITLCLWLLSCSLFTSLVGGTENPTPTNPGNQSSNVMETAPSSTQQPTEDKPATAHAQATFETGATLTRSAVYQQSTSTQEMAEQIAATDQADQIATEQVQGIFNSIQALADQGEISKTEGTFQLIPDMELQEAKINYFNWSRIEDSTEEFALESDIDYAVASDKANWFNTGCGVVFAEKSKDVFHFLKLSLDGFATLRSYNKGNWKVILQKSFGKPPIPEGKMHMFLVVQDKHVHLVIDGEPIFHTYTPLVSEGGINLSLSSGINTGFGTRCSYSNIGLWIFD